jgi:site-specific recombinase XerD
MEAFKNYLRQKSYTERTIKGHLVNIGYFLKWITDTGLYEPENIQYNNLLEYVQYEQRRQIDTATINLRLCSISKYFDFLKQRGAITRNPARTLRIRGKAKTVVEYPLSYEELQQLYHSYKAQGTIPVSSNGYTIPRHIQKRMLWVHERNTIITGLMIWQGLHSGELAKLETTHIDVDAGTIYIPSTARGNSRELKLQNQQIINLYSYLHDGTRDKLLPAADELIPGNLYGIINLLVAQLKGINPQIKNALHIRASVILHWLKQYSKRQVQYMIGHRHITSTEIYALQDMEDLTDELTKHHPFG